MAERDPGHAALLEFQTIIEPFRIHSTQRIQFHTRQERLEAIQRAGARNKTFKKTLRRHLLNSTLYK